MGFPTICLRHSSFVNYTFICLSKNQKWQSSLAMYVTHFDFYRKPCSNLYAEFLMWPSPWRRMHMYFKSPGILIEYLRPTTGIHAWVGLAGLTWWGPIRGGARKREGPWAVGWLAGSAPNWGWGGQSGPGQAGSPLQCSWSSCSSVLVPCLLYI